jgi:cell division protein FtsI (penicillin-binding protein 3)
VVSSETAEKMRMIMESVVGPHGTAETAAIPGYRVAGKTGTAWRHDEKCGCYKGYTASFIGFAPADDPAYVVNVTIQAPKGVYYGGYLGGPVFKEVMSYILQSQNIPPTAKAESSYALNYKEYLRKISNPTSSTENKEPKNSEVPEKKEKKKRAKVDARG